MIESRDSADSIMFIDNVTTTIQASIESEWVDWMMRGYVPAVLQTGRFSACRMHKVLGCESDS